MECELDEALRVQEDTSRDRLIGNIENTNIHADMCNSIKSGMGNVFFMTTGVKHAEDEAVTLVRSKIADQGMTHRYKVEICDIFICVSLVKKDENPPRISVIAQIKEQLEKHEDILNALAHHPLVGPEMELARKRFEEWKESNRGQPASSAATDTAPAHQAERPPQGCPATHTKTTAAAQTSRH